MRTGYTTGSNAAAAAKAATLALLTAGWTEQVVITLPNGETTTMTPVERSLTSSTAFCGMVKDAGDDPDVTHGALICARVQHAAAPGIHLEGGTGVGRVTLPGLGLDVGSAAINPVPRQQIHANVRDAVQQAAPAHSATTDSERHGLAVMITVPEGERLAQKTLNPRLGIIGGISILGTSGKVFPYSTAAWRSSVVQAVQMAAHNSTAKVVLATGARSERFAMHIFPDLPAVAFVELSIFTGDALKTCLACGVQSATVVAMISRVVKTAQGAMNTHVAGSPVDLAFLLRVCREVGAPDDLAAAVASANTARHVLELCQQWGYMQPIQRLLDLALEQMQRFVQRQGGSIALEIILVDFDGAVLGRAEGKA
jgi:cobalt-precorrin-5B (C1)-methyltransferase